MTQTQDEQHRAELASKRWLVTWCKPNCENRAQDGLVRGGYRPFVPSRAVTVSHAGKSMLVRRPLFPRYVLVALDPHQSWYPILSTSGVAGLITNGSKPVTLPKWVIEKLLEADASQAFDRTSEQDFREGQRVRIIASHLEGFVGEIMRVPEGRRIAVLLEMFGKKQKLNVPLDQLRAA